MHHRMLRLPELRFTPQGVALVQSASGVSYEANDLGTDGLAGLLVDLARPDQLASSAMFSMLERMGLAACVTAHPWACDSFLGLRRAARFWDYADPQALARDARDMLAFEAEAPDRPADQAGSCKTFDAAALRKAKGAGFASLVDIGHAVLRSRGRARFHHQCVERRLVPSIGARHGLGCYALLQGDQPEPVPQVPLPALVIAVDYERYQWRYRTSWIYQCIFLDLGHAIAAIQMLARRQGLSLRFAHADAGSLPRARALRSEPLVLIHVDNDVACTSAGGGAFE